MKKPRRYRTDEDIPSDVLEHYRHFAACIAIKLGEEFAYAAIMLDDEIERRKARGSDMDRIRGFLPTERQPR